MVVVVVVVVVVVASEAATAVLGPQTGGDATKTNPQNSTTQHNTHTYKHTYKHTYNTYCMCCNGFILQFQQDATDQDKKTVSNLRL
jgi:hypothetical protein